MKNYISLFLSMLFFAALQAQDVDMKPIAVSFTRLPENPLPFEYKTYTVKVDAKPGILGRLNKSLVDIANYFHLNRYEAVAEGADFTIEVFINDMAVWSEKVESQTSTTKDKAGNEVLKTEYYKEVTYTMHTSYQLLDKQGEALGKSVPISQGFESCRSAAFISTYQLEKYWAAERETTINNHVIGVYNKDIGQMLSNIRKKIDLTPMNNLEDEIEVIGGKSEAAAYYLDAYNTVKAAFARLKPNEPVDEVKRALQPAIEFYQAESAKYSATDKKQYKWLHVCLYNLALIHYWLDDITLAEQYANECQKIDWMNNRTEKLLKEIDELRQAFELTGFLDRHPAMNM